MKMREEEEDWKMNRKGGGDCRKKSKWID